MCPILQKTIILISIKIMMKMHALSVNPHSGFFKNENDCKV